MVDLSNDETVASAESEIVDALYDDLDAQNPFEGRVAKNMVFGKNSNRKFRVDF